MSEVSTHRVVSRVDVLEDYDNGKGQNSQLATNKSRPVNCPGMNRKLDFVNGLFRHELYTPKLESKVDFLLQLSERDFTMVFEELRNGYDELIGYKTNQEALSIVLDLFEQSYKGRMDDVLEEEDEEEFDFERYMD